MIAGLYYYRREIFCPIAEFCLKFIYYTEGRVAKGYHRVVRESDIIWQHHLEPRVDELLQPLVDNNGNRVPDLITRIVHTDSGLWLCHDLLCYLQSRAAMKTRNKILLDNLISAGRSWVKQQHLSPEFAAKFVVGSATYALLVTDVERAAMCALASASVMTAIDAVQDGTVVQPTWWNTIKHFASGYTLADVSADRHVNGGKQLPRG
jgi:hypothetical protein